MHHDEPASFRRRLRGLLEGPVVAAMALQLAGMALGVIAGVVIARLGSPEIKGVAAAFAATTVLLATAVGLDVPQQCLVTVRQSGDLTIARRLLLSAWCVYGAVALSLIVLMAVFSTTAVWAIVGSLLYLVGGQAAVVAGGVHSSTSPALNAMLQQVIMIVGAVAFATLGTLNADSVKLVIISSYLAPIPFMWRWLPKDAHARRTCESSEVLRLLARGFRWQLARLFQFSLMRLDTLLVFSLLGAAAGGIYSVGWSTAALVGMVSTQVSHLVTRRGVQGLLQDVQRPVFVALTSSTVSAIPLAAVGSWLIPAVYGSDFAGAYSVLILSLPGVCAFGVSQVIFNFLRMRDDVAALTAWHASGLAVMCAIAGGSIRAYGMEGAAAAFSIGNVIVALSLFLYTRGLDRGISDASNYTPNTPR